MAQNTRTALNIPIFRGAPPHNRFCVDMAGRISNVRGNAIEDTGISEADWPTRTIFDLYQDAPALATFYATLYAGRSATTVVEFGSATWLMEADPLFIEGKQVGITGIAWKLEPEPEVADTEPREAYRVYEAAGDNTRRHVWSGDRFHVNAERALLVRRIALQEFDRLIEEDPTHVHLLHDASSSPPSLRLLP